MLHVIFFFHYETQKLAVVTDSIKTGASNVQAGVKAGAVTVQTGVKAGAVTVQAGVRKGFTSVQNVFGFLKNKAITKMEKYNESRHNYTNCETNSLNSTDSDLESAHVLDSERQLSVLSPEDEDNT